MLYRLEGGCMKKFSVFAVILIFLSVGCVKQEETRIISVVSSVGEVKIITQGKEISSNPGTVLRQNDSIITGNASFVDLSFLDKGIIRIGENSNINLEALAANETKENVSLNMQKGKLVVTISRLRKNSSFEVKTSTSVAAVRGTTLKVVSDESSSKVYVVKGKVSVSPVSEGKAITAAEKVVEENYAVALEKKEVKEIVESKKEIQPVEIAKSEIAEIKEILKEVVKTTPANIEMVREANEIVAEEKVEVKKEAEKKMVPRVQKKENVVPSHEVKSAQPVGQQEKSKTNIPIVPNL